MVAGSNPAGGSTYQAIRWGEHTLSSSRVRGGRGNEESGQGRHMLGARRLITLLSVPKVFLIALDDEPTPSGSSGEEFPEG